MFYFQWGQCVCFSHKVGSREALLKRMLKLSRKGVVDAVQQFYEKLLEWFEFTEKLTRLARELTTVVQEWINRECVGFTSLFSRTSSLNSKQVYWKMHSIL